MWNVCRSIIVLRSHRTIIWDCVWKFKNNFGFQINEHVSTRCLFCPFGYVIPMFQSKPKNSSISSINSSYILLNLGVIISRPRHHELYSVKQGPLDGTQFVIHTKVCKKFQKRKKRQVINQCQILMVSVKMHTAWSWILKCDFFYSQISFSNCFIVLATTV